MLDCFPAARLLAGKHGMFAPPFFDQARSNTLALAGREIKGDASPLL
jgi:hypothetical protein